jgi:hypothetical protein
MILTLVKISPINFRGGYGGVLSGLATRPRFIVEQPLDLSFRHGFSTRFQLKNAIPMVIGVAITNINQGFLMPKPASAC